MYYVLTLLLYVFSYMKVMIRSRNRRIENTAAMTANS